MLDTLEKVICITFGPSLVASLEPLGHRRNVASLSIGITLVDIHLNWIHLLILLAGQKDFKKVVRFSVTIRRCYKDVYLNSFFPCTARLWNYLSAECFPLTYDLNGFKSRVNRHHFSLGGPLPAFIYPFCSSFSCNSMCRSGCSALHEVKPN